MLNPQDKVSIRFIGRKAPFFDNLYGTKLTFESQQVRAVPTDIAKKFLKHGDLFELASDVEAQKAAPAPIEQTEIGLLGSDVQPSLIEIKGKEVQLGYVVRHAFAASELTPEAWNALDNEDREARIAAAIEEMRNADDTDAIIEAAKQEKAEQEEERNNLEDIRQRVMLSESKDELADMAQTHWNQKLNKQKSVENLRAQVLQYIDQFGIA